MPADRFFAISGEVREVIEKTVEQNALAMSIGELPKPPAFLIGQVGDQRIAFHGTSGSFFLTHENLLGASSNGNTQINDSRDPAANIIDRTEREPVGVIDVGRQETSEGTEGSERKREREVPVDPDQGAVGPSDGRGAGSSEGDRASVHGVLDGSFDEAGGIEQIKLKPGEVLAVVEPGSCRDDGGSSHAAAL